MVAHVLDQEEEEDGDGVGEAHEGGLEERMRGSRARERRRRIREKNEDRTV